MIRTRALGRQEEEHQVYRLIVHGIVVDRHLELSKYTVDCLQVREAAMRDRDALPHARGAKALTLDQDLEDPPFRHVRKRRCLRRQFLEELLLALCLQPRKDGLWRKQI